VLEATRRKSMFEVMLRIRMIEERIVELYKEQEMRCPTHFSIGQEAIAAGVCAHLNNQDYVMSAHRSHAHYLAKNGDLKRMLAELYGKDTGCARGKGGSMHLIDIDVGFLGCVPIVGSTIPIGVGIAFGACLQNQDAITTIFFGDGATETGVFHESVNYAAIHKLPVLFICENNLYSCNTTLESRQPANRSIADLARGHGIVSFQADGQECDTVFETTANAIQEIRAGNGPVLLEFFTYRWLEHCGPNLDLHLGFRKPGEYEYWLKRDPIDLYKAQLLKEDILSELDIDNMRKKIQLDLHEAEVFAKESPFPPASALMSDVFPQTNVKMEFIREETCQIVN
jgi:TPP-dependent pyruvate/acetoin dehydrogenase alpha subunit